MRSFGIQSEPMTHTHIRSIRSIVAICVALLLVGAAAYFLTERVQAPTPEHPVTTTPTESPKKDGVEVSIPATQGRAEVKTMPAPKTPTVPAPSLAYVPIKKVGVSDELFTEAKTRITEASQVIQKDSTRTDSWLVIALYKHALQDDTGAEEIWKYLHTVSPGMIQPVLNLARLYQDQGKLSLAADYYKKAQDITPNDPQIYQSLHDVYVSLGRVGDAEAILRTGMTANPKSSELAVSLARYLVARGRVDDAKAVYATALKIVQAAGNKTLEAAISQEAASL